MEITIKDIKGKELGKLILTDEVEEVLLTTGVLLVIEYNAKEQKLTSYLH